MHASELWEGRAFGPVLARCAPAPFSLLYGIGWEAYLGIYWLGLKKAAHPHSPILCVGNLVSGGSGKTPVVLHLIGLLREMGCSVVVSSSGYGIPVNVTRSYSANCADEGPLGFGWNLSVDIRSTAGGLLKSSGAPIRSVPIAFKERNTAQTLDPNAEMYNGTAMQPAEAVIATDASGKEETEQRDVDGIITTPPWNKNTNDPVYEEVMLGGNIYKVLVSNTVITPDGTRYLYQKKGYFNGGAVSINGTGSAEPSNILKIVSVTDRHGNATEYHYGSGTVSFAKPNGTAIENPLTYITMPNGHRINFTWGNGTNAPTNRIRTADDDIGSGGRTVTYGYNSSGDLTTVTTPAGFTTTYGYDQSGYINAGGSYSVAGLNHVITSITDPRGLTTYIGYTLDDVNILPYNATMQSVKAYKVIQPNGISTYYANSGAFNDLPSDSYFYSSGPEALAITAEYADIASGQSQPFQQGTLNAASSTGSPPYFEVGMGGIGGYSPMSVAGTETWRKQYDSRTQDLIWEAQYCAPMTSTLLSNRRMESTNGLTKVESSTVYNFMGSPLSKTITEAATPSSSNFSYSNTRVQTTDFAYWGEDKYFQQKASRIRTGASTYRYNFTDYFDSSAATGKKGQTRYVYNPAYTSFYLDTGITPPSGTSSGDYWKYQLKPSDANTYAGSFDYDSKGRAIDVWKLQSVSGSTYNRVQTHTTYGADSSPHWGQAYQVVEDYGSGKINRTTTTNGYTSWGSANDVTDAAGHRFYTNYDADGKVNSIYRLDGSYNDPIVTYTYGTSGLTNGVVTSLTDGLSGVIQDFTYQTASGGGKAQVASVTETNGSASYSSSYTYDGAGDRETTIYATPNGTTRWKYADYVSAGNPGGPGRIFQTFVKLDSSSNPTPEEFHYSYDGSGKLLMASFAQTPASGFTPTTGNSWYDSSHPASTRSRAYYVYDAAGRTTQLNHWWDTWNSGSSSYGTPEAILSNTCSYEITTGTANYNRGAKTSSSFYSQNSSDHTQFAHDRTEYYSYDNNLDYLTSADYNDGQANENPNWSYDAAGNRNDATVVDNLNRATTIGGISRTYSILGNTLTKGGSVSYAWDVLNRMSTYTNGSVSTNYQYRADGMRTKKTSTTTTEWFFYDGQMPVEVTGLTSSATTVTRNGLGARGIDLIERVGVSTTIGYPIYDAHGNMVATLGKSGLNYSINDQRSYDAWGGLRLGNTTGDPNGRYCANLGHVQDDESGLLYMRARYLEYGSGRFLTEDPAKDSFNWLVYGGNDPVSHVDLSGLSFETRWLDILKRIQDALKMSDPRDGIAALNDLFGEVDGQNTLDIEDAEEFVEQFGEFSDPRARELAIKRASARTLLSKMFLKVCEAFIDDALEILVSRIRP